MHVALLGVLHTFPLTSTYDKREWWGKQTEVCKLTSMSVMALAKIYFLKSAKKSIFCLNWECGGYQSTCLVISRDMQHYHTDCLLKPPWLLFDTVLELAKQRNWEPEKCMTPSKVPLLTTLWKKSLRLDSLPPPWWGVLSLTGAYTPSLEICFQKKEIAALLLTGWWHHLPVLCCTQHLPVDHIHHLPVHHIQNHPDNLSLIKMWR